MAISNFLTAKYTALVELRAQEASVADIVTSGAYETDAIGARSVKINFPDSVTIGDYVPGVDMTIQELSDSQKILTMDQDKYFSFHADDSQMAQSAGDFVTAAFTEAGKGLALKADTYSFGSTIYGDAGVAAAGNLMSAATITVTNIEEQIAGMAELLRVNHVSGGAFLIVPPWIMTILVRAKVAAVTDNMASFEGRNVAKYAGLTIVESTEIIIDGSSQYNLMAFSPRAIPFAASVNNVETLRSEKRFGNIVRGQYVFGAKLLFPAELVVLPALK